MIDTLYFNGFLIQALYTDEYSQDYPNYNGTGRYVSWPLEWKEDSISKELTDEANNKWFHRTYFGEDVTKGDVMLCTVGDLDYLHRYINHCNDLGINIRILQIESTRPYPIFENIEQRRGKVLGYEYSSGGSFASMQAEDLEPTFDGEFMVLKQFYEKLNSNGLFENMEDIKRYVSTRQEMLDKGVSLVIFGAMLIMLITDVTENLKKV